jgi:hypothetical protein
LHELRFFNEYAAATPTWCSAIDLYPGFPDGLSTELQADLRQHAFEFNENYDADTGEWPDDFDSRAHFERGKELAARLANELGSGWEVIYEPWEHRKPKQKFLSQAG